LWEAKLAKEKFDSDSHGNQASMPWMINVRHDVWRV
jgi:hypothetical protein